MTNPMKKTRIAVSIGIIGILVFGLILFMILVYKYWQGENRHQETWVRVENIPLQQNFSLDYEIQHFPRIDSSTSNQHIVYSSVCHN